MPSGLKTISFGRGPTVTGLPTTGRFVDVSITVTLLPLAFPTYSRDPSGETARPTGWLPTAMGIPITVLVDVSITLTVLSAEFET